MIRAMILAWILTCFEVDNIFTEAINQIFNTNYTTAIYWLLFLNKRVGGRGGKIKMGTG